MTDRFDAVPNADELSSHDVSYPYPGAQHPEAYEWLNLCSDPEQKVEAVIERFCAWNENDLLDIGAGSCFHALRYAQRGARVYAVEPDPRLRQQAFARLAAAPPCHLSIVAGDAEHIPAPDNAFDIAIARFAYFFGTDACLPGLQEVRRVMRPAGHFFVVDVDPTYGTWGEIARRAYPEIFEHSYAEHHRAFYAALGFSSYAVPTAMRAPSLDVLRSVFQMDFPHMWRELLGDGDVLEFGYGLMIYHLVVDEPLPSD